MKSLYAAPFSITKWCSNVTDHDALFAGGCSLEEAFANAGLGMFNYMTPLSEIAKDPSCSRCAIIRVHLLSGLCPCL
jgi:hypothetical protein